MSHFLLNLSIYSVLIPFATGLVLWKLQDTNARIMILLLAFASFSQVIGSQSKDHKYLIYNLYILIDLIFWSLLLFRNTSTALARLIIVILFLTINALAIYTFISQGINKAFYSYFICFDNIIQVICVLMYFFERYYNEKITRLSEDPMFWFCLGILFYAPCTYFLFVYRSAMGSVPQELWNYHHILNFLLYLLITAGLLVKIKTAKFLVKWI